MDARCVAAATVAAAMLLYAVLASGFKMPRSARQTADVAIVCVASLTLALLLMQRARPNEHYTDASVASLDKILSIIGIQNTAAADVQATALNVALLSSDYNENLQTIASSLTLYYSAFSTKSYPTNGRTWYNIAPFFSSPASTCPDVRVDDTHMQFSQNVSFSRENGFGIGSTSITGPRAFQMGLAGNSSFTLFMCINFTDFANTAPDQPFELLRLPANTSNNNGVLLAFDPQVTRVGTLYATKLTLGVGSQQVVARDPTTDSNVILVDPSFTYLLVLVKNNLDVSLTLYPNIDNIGSNYKSGMQVVQWRVDATEDILFSNKEMRINAHNNIYGNLYNFGAYNTALDNSRVGMLYMHTQAELHKTNQLLQDLAAQIAALKQQVDAAKQCPYNAQVCDACPAIKDWTNTTNIIASGDDKCLSMIDAYCTNNPRADLCACWNPNNTLSRTTECKNYVNIFRKADALDPALLEEIKSKNNLCSCDSANPSTSTGTGAAAAALPTATQQRKQPWAVRVSDKYSVDEDDLRAYNEMEVIQFYDQPTNNNINNTAFASSTLRMPDPFAVDETA